MNRRGSALLIVLGVLSFLVVSAVAFSAFMRRSRLPSSYLRRSVASRQLAKAALASAIDEIDRAIANGVHPGIGGNAENKWRDRVFFKGDDEQSITDTAPTLTFEGLAYIPPPLVNEARYWSRKTPTAKWQKIPYDVGRYAYCALDVSDYFDVNRLMSTYPRSSAANRRITISHLLEPSGENEPHNGAPSDAKKWDDFMEKFRKVDAKTLEIDYESSSTIPLVSMADFNLALAAEKGIGNIKSAFGEYVENNLSQFYPGKGSKELRPYAEMTFVTDGWFPKSRNATVDASGNTQTTERYDIGDGKYQPYQMDMLKKDDSVFLSEAVVFYKDIAPSAEAKIWNERLSGFGMAALADYLDEDHYPISLSVPTTEQVPMICGIEVKLSQPPVFSVEYKEEKMTYADGSELDTSDQQATTREVKQEVNWTIKGYELDKGFQGGKVHTLVTYPFLHSRTQTPEWKLDGIFSLFLTADSPMQFRTDNPRDMLSLKKQNLPGTGMSDDREGVLTVNLGTAAPNFPKEYSKEEDAVRKCELDMRGGKDLSAKLNDNPLLKVTYEWTQTRQMKDDKMTEWSPKLEDVQSDPSLCKDLTASTVLPALDMSGNVSSKFKDDDALSQMIKSGDKVHVHLNAAVWLRIKEGEDGEVVDMVPAHVADDGIQNPGNKDPKGDIFSGSTGSLKVLGASGPVMKFTTGIDFDFGVEGMKKLESSTDTIEISPKALMVSDPRHNHMPENWFADNAGSITPKKWLDSLDDLDGTRDGDIFMATSDAGYLQSIYELAFLPRFKPLAGTTQSRAGNYNIPTGNNWHDGVYADKAGGTLNAEFMWRTYDPIGEDRDAFNEFPFTSEGTGMKVNPYSNSTNVLMAAFANTPVSWRYAHTNYEFNTELKNYQEKAAEFNKNFNENCAWNGYSNYEDSKFMWTDLEKVAGIFMDCVRTAGNSGWTTAWNNFKWYDLCADGKLYASPEVAKESKTANLWDADRKFLYGFWRDCFAARQQLFLIFVRAEPLLLGGGSADQLPPQLGARAVALVWRDPTPVSGSDVKDGYPHRTRILFYKPLD